MSKTSEHQSNSISASRLSPWLFTIGIIISSGLLINQICSMNPKIYNPLTLTRFLFTKHLSTSNDSSTNLLESLVQFSDGLPKFSSIRVVSLPDRLDRRNHMNRLDRFLNLGIQFSDAIVYEDQRVIEIVKRVGNHTKADKGFAQVGHVACRMSHRLAIEAADRNDEEVTLILEDDVDFETAFKYLAGTILRDVPENWDMIFFGHTDFSDESRNGRDPSMKNFFIYPSIEPQGGHAYALSRQGRRLILDLLDNKRPELYETDEGQPIDEIFMYLARLRKAKLYSIIPDLVVQRSLFKSDIFGTPAGFEDGMHNKVLLDSALIRIQEAEKTSNQKEEEKKKKKTNQDEKKRVDIKSGSKGTGTSSSLQPITRSSSHQNLKLRFHQSLHS